MELRSSVISIYMKLYIWNYWPNDPDPAAHDPEEGRGLKWEYKTPPRPKMDPGAKVLLKIFFIIVILVSIFFGGG